MSARATAATPHVRKLMAQGLTEKGANDWAIMYGRQPAQRVSTARKAEVFHHGTNCPCSTCGSDVVR